jgi:hypothetical protein
VDNQSETLFPKKPTIHFLRIGTQPIFAALHLKTRTSSRKNATVSFRFYFLARANRVVA